METNKIGFLILHYMAMDATINCVKSIENNIDTTQYQIIIVDNASPNGSGIKLKSYFKNNDKVTVLLNKSNIGFAKGNNVGFRYARNELKCHFICMLNNDTLLEQKNFFHCIKKTFEKYDCAVMGPKIFLKNGTINPILPKLGTVRNYQKDRFLFWLSMLKTYLGFDFIDFSRLFQKKMTGTDSASSTGIIHKDVILHGCCLIFTPKYLEKFSGINDKTFMFREEELLYVRLKKYSLLSLYSPEINICHLEDVATDMVQKTKRNKKLFICRNQIKSLKILIDEMKKMK